MTQILNNWVGYIDRSFQQIKESVLKRLVINNPEITDHSETNILIIIISIFSGIGEMINYYIDNMAREAFISSATRFDSMVKLVKILDYRIKARSAESTDLIFTIVDNTGNITTSVQNTLIPQGTVIKTSNNINFITEKDIVIQANNSSISVGASQTLHIINSNIGTTSGIANQKIPLGNNYQHNTLSIIINNKAFTRVETLGFSKGDDRHFIIEIDSDGLAKIIFGDGTNGVIPESPHSIMATYQITDGPISKVDADTLTTIVNTITVFGSNLSLKVTNPVRSSGGAFYEDVTAIRKNAPLSIRTLNRAVNKQDYIDLLKSFPGVQQGDVIFNCGKTIEAYIAPTGGGLASSILLSDTKAFLESVKMITTKINIQSSGESIIYLKITGKAKFRLDPIQARQDVINALLDFGSIAKQKINNKIKLSDLYAIMDNLVTIDFVNIDKIYAIPYFRPFNHITQLNFLYREILPTSNTTDIWKIEWSGSQFRIRKNRKFLRMLLVGEEFIDVAGSIKFVILSGLYTPGMSWDMTTYPYNKNIDIDDNTIPIIDINYLDVDITGQNYLSTPN